MITEDTLRQSLHEQAEATPPPAGLAATALARGRRRRRTRRTGAMLVGAAALTAAVVGGMALTDQSGAPATTAGSVASSATQPPAQPSSPWWRRWPVGRHVGTVGTVDKAFIDAVAAPYGSKGITVYASGTAADGTEFALYLDPADGHTPQWIQGWQGAPDFGEAGFADASTTWMSFSSPSLAAHDSAGGTLNQQWLIVVGRPGTTGIDYSADGSHWTSVPTQHGIGLLLIRDGYPPSTARVRLSDSSGVYATGVPFGAGAGTPSTAATNPSSGPGTGSTAAPQVSKTG